MTPQLERAYFRPLRELARIFVADDGGPIRTIIGTRPTIWTGEYYSAKTRRSHPWESPFELSHFYRLEADPQVVDYLAQPHGLEVWFDGHRYFYFPDAKVRLADDTTEIREIKKSSDEIAQDPFYETKLILAHAVYEDLGWKFRVLDDADIHKPAIVFENCFEIQLDGCLEIRDEEVRKVRELYTFANCTGVVALGRIADALGGWVRGASLARAMMVRRILAIPLDRRITVDTPVTLMSRHRVDTRRPRSACETGQ